MKYDDHCINLGRLWGNLQSLEVDLRLFLTQANACAKTRRKNISLWQKSMAPIGLVGTMTPTVAQSSPSALATCGHVVAGVVITWIAGPYT